MINKRPDKLEHKYEEYIFVQENRMKIFELWRQNVLIDDFKYSRRSGLALIFIPGIVNLCINKLAPNMHGQYILSVSCFIGIFYNFLNQYRQDIQSLIHKDTPLSNQIRLCIQNTAYFDPLQEDYLHQTLDIIQQRKINQS